MATLDLTLALGHYDRHIAFIDGSVTIEGVSLKLLTEATPNDRHENMLRRGAYHVAEVSLASYLVARDRGLPFTAIPVFPRRLFSQSQMYRHASANIKSPSDLLGKRVGLTSYQTTLCVLAKGDLLHEYGVSWKDIHWVSGLPDIIDTAIPIGVQVEQASGDLSGLLARGELHALFSSRVPRCILDGHPAVDRLFTDPRAEERRYFERNGFFPIMHLIVLRNDVIQQHPWLPHALMNAFNRARELTMHHWDDPNWSSLAWGRHLVEEEKRFFTRNPWTDGLAPNRANLERFMTYAYEQGLILAPQSIEGLFDVSTIDI